MKVKRNPPKIDAVHRDAPRSRGSMMGTCDYKNMVLPGQDLMKRVTPRSYPLEPGLYLVFFQYDPPLAWSGTERNTGLGTAYFDDSRWQEIRTVGSTLSNFVDGKFSIGSKVLAYMGPIPTLSLKAMKEFTPGFPINQTFYISTLKQAASLKYSSGPHAEFLLAVLNKGYEDEFIFKYDSDHRYPIPIYRYVPESKKSNLGWEALTEKETKFYTQKMKEY